MGLDAAKECDRLPRKSVAARQCKCGRESSKSVEPEKPQIQKQFINLEINFQNYHLDINLK